MKTHRTQSRQNRLRRQCTLICAAALVFATEANSAGAPLGQAAYVEPVVDGQLPLVVVLLPMHNPAEFLPYIAFPFHIYSMEWTANGQMMPPPDFSNYEVGGCYEPYSCTWWATKGLVNVGDVQQTFVLRNLKWATEYCFRFQDQSRGWTEYSCARTPAAPRFPAPQVSDTYDPNTPTAIPAGPIKAGGRVNLPRSSGPSLSKCDAAQVARTRNSPAAPGLEAQCRVEQEAARLASIGEAIAAADPAVAALRNRSANPLYLHGFDVATGIFGDPALGAVGNTAMGPGSEGIRNSLSALGQRGFNAATDYHLAPKQ